MKDSGKRAEIISKEQKSKTEVNDSSSPSLTFTIRKVEQGVVEFLWVPKSLLLKLLFFSYFSGNQALKILFAKPKFL